VADSLKMIKGKNRNRRLRRENRTIRLMIEMYCRVHHNGSDLCAECRALTNYAMKRLDACPYDESKPTCVTCPTHCYKPAMRERIKEIMRFAGPRMIYHHPLLAMLHLVDGLKKPPQR
jgi:hypothetical protein